MITGFILLAIACLTYTLELIPFYEAGSCLLVVVAGMNFVRSAVNMQASRRFRITAVAYNGSITFHMRDRKFKRTYDLEIIPSVDNETSLSLAYDNLDCVSFRTNHHNCSYETLLEHFGEMTGRDRCHASDQIHNMLLILSHRNPIMTGIKESDFVVSASARHYFRSALRRVV